MSPRTYEEATPIVDDIDAHIAQEMAAFRTRIEGEFAIKHLGEVCEEHPLFVRAATLWMHATEREIMAKDTNATLPKARLEALARLGNELEKDGEDPALIDIIETFKKVTRADEELPEQVEVLAA
jgi:hypothetical protein